MLPPLLRALQYVHSRGLVHGRIQPSNILAIADQVKLSSDSLSEADDGTRRSRALTILQRPEQGQLRRRAMFGSWESPWLRC